MKKAWTELLGLQFRGIMGLTYTGGRLTVVIQAVPNGDPSK